MDKTLIENWNSRVTDSDEVHIIGDFAFRAAENVESMLKRMKGIKHLIIGNHDHSWMNTLEIQRYFASVQQMGYLSLNGQRLYLCHYPMMSWNNSMHGSYLIYGHIHAGHDQDYWPLIANNDHMLNTGVDINHYYPVTFDELVANNAAFKEEHS